MRVQAQLRLKKDEVEKLGAAAYLVLPADLYRTKMSPFFKDLHPDTAYAVAPTKGVGPVFGTVLSDPAGYASALYGVCMKKQPPHDYGFENDPYWFVIDRGGIITYAAAVKWVPVNDVDDMLESLKKAAR